MPSSLLENELAKLQTVGSVLYVAAHPDDENTALLTYLAQEAKLDTAYLSLTRGGGGQNLIGPELKEGLGVIRANELLAARRIDGATQLFTRARDFGYSKNAEDTLENWEEDEVLGDMVYILRHYQPDVIITRFNPYSSGTHGHHTVSAQLALRAFALAADPSAFPEQLERLDTHQAKRILWNGYSWGRGGMGETRGDSVYAQIGQYNPYLGSSYTEIAARSRSMHKSQGFGRAGRRGPQEEQLIWLAGEPTGGELLRGIDTSWERFEEGAKVARWVKEAIERFDPAAPWESVEALARADEAMDALPDTRLVRSQRERLGRVVAGALGLHVEARSPVSSLLRGEATQLEVEVVNRSPLEARLQEASARMFDGEIWPRYRILNRMRELESDLESNEPRLVTLAIRVPEDAPLTEPYWLRREPSEGLYRLENRRLLEIETIPPAMEVEVGIEVFSRIMRVATPVVRVESDPVHGEVREKVLIRPKVVVRPETHLLLFEDDEPMDILVSVASQGGSLEGQLRAEVPPGWKARLADPDFRLSESAPEQRMRATIAPPKEGSQGAVIFRAVDSDGGIHEVDLRMVEYDHIGRHPMLVPARVKVARLDLRRAGKRIGYLEGVGDPVPDTLEKIGYHVERLEVAQLDEKDLRKYDTVILGPRVFDALEGLDVKYSELLAYVEGGGTLISQYNTTSSRAKSRFAAPFPLTLSRVRVAEERAKVSLLEPGHPAFSFPNKIVSEDFDGWTQERGLYFASSWDSRYTALLSAHDRGEPPREGGLLVARHGKGWYVYTGLSFFRQLPEGNAGAIRLFVNLISLGHEE